MRAWRTESIGITSLVIAETRAQAIADTLRSANDAGWEIAWADVRAIRWPEMDRFSRYAWCTPRRCWAPDWVEATERDRDRHGGER